MITPESHPNGTLCCDGPTETSLIAIYCRFPDQFKIHPPQIDWFLFEPYRFIVREFLKRGPAITNATGAFGAGNDVELMELSEATVGWAGIDQMIDRVKDCAKVRSISRQARELAEDLTPDDLSPALEVCAGISSEIAEDAPSWSDAATDVGRDMEEAAKSFREIDLGISGLKARTSELIMIAARPGGGKTTLLHQIAELTSLTLPGVSLVWTMEMTRAEWWAKTIQQLEGRYVAPNSREWLAAIPKARRHYAERRLQVNDKSEITCQDVRAKCAELRANNTEISAIYVDYLTLMHLPRKRDESLTDAIGAPQKLEPPPKRHLPLSLSSESSAVPVQSIPRPIRWSNNPRTAQCNSGASIEAVRLPHHLMGQIPKHSRDALGTPLAQNALCSPPFPPGHARGERSCLPTTWRRQPTGALSTGPTPGYSRHARGGFAVRLPVFLAQTFHPPIIFASPVSSTTISQAPRRPAALARATG